MKHCRVLAALSLASALLGTGCNNSSPSNNVTVDFSGTLQVHGLNSHDFSASRNGEFSVRVTSLAPNQAVLIGIYIGQPNGGLCGQLGSVTPAGLNTAAINGPLNKGNYCLGIVDPGTLSAATTYTVQLSHP